ncbi:hypothetical protein HYN56_04480 [Flavobacterium crocinum]|uniref:Immunity protein 30 domain-containing protein n=1 Tax=Flavobacterium crocinum TaxID=2183896 RepID=A0A2S1YHH4_9FLAO|nr:hypothetical protein [Flavobacterium crocinum]AWK03517.1 hypothetical protein HYN56_04480 [Flavobacterium crocinum]
MTDQIKTIITNLEQYIQKAYETGDKYEFIDPAYEIRDELEAMEDNFNAIEPIFELIERSPDIDYGGPGPLGSFMENYYKNGYEELLLQSIERKPTEYTLGLLHRLINDDNNAEHQKYLEIMKSISVNTKYPQNIIDNAKDSLSYFE